LQAANARGVSSALYYLFAYMFMVIGSFAVVSILGGNGDADHDIASYRGLARRQPLLAFVFAVLLLAQAGVPFTTGFLTKFQVVVAAVDAHSVPLAVVAMVSAAVAAFFYLRVTVLMYAPSDGEPAADGQDAASVNRGRLNSALILEGTPVGVAVAGRVAVPWPAVVAIGICVAVTIVLGIIPAPLVDFAHRAGLLFLP
ncbi:MAG: proton-conducting transporter membrane subunit, partial [Acidimicrobiales bacterium]